MKSSSLSSVRSLKNYVFFMLSGLVFSAHADVTLGPITNPANGHDYYLLTTTNWTASEAEAVSMGGHLVSINDSDEQAWVQSTFGDYGNLWIGLSDEIVEGNYLWTSAQSFSYSNWLPGQPNNTAADGGPENYTLIWWNGYGETFAGKWTDVVNDSGGYNPLGVVEVIPPLRELGQLSLSIEPVEVEAIGVALIDQSIVVFHGQTTPVNAGVRKVSFIDVPGWITPPDQFIRIVGSDIQATPQQVTGRYQPLIAYAIDVIPPQSVWGSRTASFTIVPSSVPAPATFQASVLLGAPTGTIHINPNDGHFIYTPGEDDIQPFTLRFIAANGGLSETNDVVFSPAPHLAPERSIFGLEPTRPLPDPESVEYISRSEVFSDTPEDFNHLIRTTRVVTVTAHTLVFEDGHPNGLYDYHENEDIRELNLIAETVIFRSPLVLPQTDVNIQAREFRFENQSWTNFVFLKTNPRELLTRPAGTDGTDGKDGLDAGDLTLLVESIDIHPSMIQAFIMNGGNGQPAGLGRDGAPGNDMPVHPNLDGTVYVYGNESFGSPAWPGDGEDAVAAGQPGEGGNGGVYSSNLPPITNQLTFSAGYAGLMGASTYGGRAGYPVDAYHLEAIPFGMFGSVYEIRAQRTSSAGADAPAPEANAPKGIDGVTLAAGHSLSWMAPGSLQKILHYNRDAYRLGYMDKVEESLSEYTTLIAVYRSLPAWLSLSETERTEFEQIEQEMQAIRYRIARNLDYYGNPAGWVPMLSFEVNRAIFDQEIDDAIRAMYLSYWLLNTVTNQQAKVQALQLAREQLRDQCAVFQSDFSEINSYLPGLQAESDAVSSRLQFLDLSIAEKERRLAARARQIVQERYREEKSWLESLASDLGAIATIFPVGQPVAGQIGAGLSLLGNSGGSGGGQLIDSLKLIGQGGGQFDNYSNWGTELAAIDFSGIDISDPVSLKDPIEQLVTLGKPVVANGLDVMEQQQQVTAPANEVEAEFAKLKANSPAYKQLTNEIQSETARKAELAVKITSSFQTLNNLAQNVSHNLLAIDGLNQGVSGANAALDHRAIRYLEEMDARARERLQRYHYYMVRAFEYRMLEAFPYELNLNSLFDSFRALAESGTGAQLNQTEFDALKALYEEQLSSIASDIFDDYNANRPELSAPIRFNLTPSEIERLNNGEDIRINLVEMGLMPPSEENLRIVDLSIDSMSATLTNGTYSSFAFMDLYFEHSGISTLVGDGELYQFRNYTETTSTPITWGARYDEFDQSIDPIQPSAASESLLKSLLSNEGIAQTDENLLLYSRPAAWADLRISKDVYSDNGIDLHINSLRIAVVYDFVRKRNDQSALQIMLAQKELTPYMLVDTRDLNQRRDGRGNFQRTYTKNSSVSVTAPAEYGNWIFDRWTDQFGGDLGVGIHTNPTVSVFLSDNESIMAHYVYGDPDDQDADGVSDTWEILHFGGLDSPLVPNDSDGDGLTDEEEGWIGSNPWKKDTDDDGMEDGTEWLAGTRINDGNDRFIIQTFDTSSTLSNTVVLGWEAKTDLRYSVLYSTNLISGWQQAGNDITPDNDGYLEVTLPKATTTFEGFRIQVENPQ